MSDINPTGNNAIGKSNSSAITDNGHAAHGSSASQAPTSPFSASYARAVSKIPNAQHAGMAPENASTLTSALPNMSNRLATALSVNGSAHIPLTGEQHGAGDHNMHETALALRAYRQQLLASNIANADTPNYKAVDIDIADALRNGRSTPSEVPLKYVVPSQGSVDGNTVEMDVERAKFAENALMYEYEVDRVKGHYQMQQELLKNLPY
jgi:flagellar basal-body rod protein FlgB